MDLDNLNGVQIKSKVKYLGLQLSFNKQTLIDQRCQSQLQKYLAYIRGKI